MHVCERVCERARAAAVVTARRLDTLLGVHSTRAAVSGRFNPGDLVNSPTTETGGLICRLTPWSPSCRACRGWSTAGPRTSSCSSGGRGSTPACVWVVVVVGLCGRAQVLVFLCICGPLLVHQQVREVQLWCVCVWGGGGGGGGGAHKCWCLFVFVRLILFTSRHRVCRVWGECPPFHHCLTRIAASGHTEPQ